MSLLSEVMADARSVINDVLGTADCTLINGNTGERTEGLDVIVRRDVDIYKDKVFVGVHHVGTFDMTACDAARGDRLYVPSRTGLGVEYELIGLHDLSDTKRVFYLSEL